MTNHHCRTPHPAGPRYGTDYLEPWDYPDIHARYRAVGAYLKALARRLASAITEAETALAVRTADLAETWQVLQSAIATARETGVHIETTISELPPVAAGIVRDGHAQVGVAITEAWLAYEAAARHSDRLAGWIVTARQKHAHLEAE